MNERIRRSTIATQLVPALVVLAELRRELAMGNHAKALMFAEELSEILTDIEGDVGSCTPMALFGV